MTGHQAIRELLRRASRAETPIVEALALAAGFLWRCAERRCGAVNDGDRYACQTCRAPRPLPQKP